MKHRAGSNVVMSGSPQVLDAPTIEFRRPGPGRGPRVRTGVWLVTGSLALGTAGLLTGFAPLVSTSAPAAPAPVSSDPMSSDRTDLATVPTPGGVDLGVVGDVGMSGAVAAPADGLPVPGGVVGLTTGGAMDRFRDAGFDNVRFLNTSGGTVLVPSDLYQVVSAPAAGSIADPDISLDVWAMKIPEVVTPAERAASDRAEAAWERRREAEMSCGLYRLDGPTSSDVADCIERRTS